MIVQNPPFAKQLKNLFPETFKKGVKQTFGEQPICPVLLELLSTGSVSEQHQADQCPTNILHPNEAAVFSNYSFYKRRSEYLTGRACAKMAVQGLIKLSSAEPAAVVMQQIEIANKTGGRPVVYLHGAEAGPPEIDISISHSGDYGVALAAGIPCGIDLQEKKEALFKVQEKYCSRDEYMLLEENLTDHEVLARLATLWAAKEAAKKALSHKQMPGFLDLELRQLKNFSRWSTLCLYISHEKIHRLPEKVTVVAGIFNEYALAICLVNEETHA